MPSPEHERSRDFDPERGAGSAEERSGPAAFAQHLVSEYRANALRRLTELEDQLDRALKASTASPEATRDITRQMREVLARAEMTFGLAGTDALDEMVLRSRDKVLRIVGTAGWGNER